jgi:hypothetical protein
MTTTTTTEDTMRTKKTDSFTDACGRQWWIGVDPSTGKAKMVVSAGGTGISTRYDLDNATRIEMVRALSGNGG